MKKILSILPRWLPAILMMTVIFLFSSRSSTELPNFLSWDYVVKKASHAIGYGLLALSFFYALGFQVKYLWLAWLLAILYSATDELHQSFVPGRHSSISDVLIFDNIGAIAALWIYKLRYIWNLRKTG
ncbi:MAG: VanZ family protein [Anaerolineales bacterium]|nr:VanZ family protein [Anaerolineales bacterium]MCZ2123663.1 VanZ family protein [Anaerolineales bacterium]